MQSLAGNEEGRLALAIRQEQHVKCETKVKAAKRSRIGRPKVRTGCKTCKIRRVKCDENKPSCRRCIKFGVECQGYPPDSKSEPQSRAIIPKKFLQPLPWTVRPLHSGPSFDSEQEIRFFRIFCNETARQIAGPFKRSGSLWTLLMPQASEHEPFVHHAIVAIGALSKVSKDGRNFHAHQARGFRRDPESEFAQEYRYALVHYDKALKGMRKAMEAGIKDLRSALLACLLAFCIETLQGRQGPACALAAKGLELFNNKNLEYRRDISDPETRRNSLEEDLVHGFTGLDIHVLFFLDSRPLTEHQRIIDNLNLELESMPSDFENISDAGHWWHKITRRDMHFNGKAQIIGQAAELGGEKPESGWTETADFSAGQVPFSKTKYSSKEIKAECQQYISDNYKWTQASSKLFSSIPKSDKASVLSAVILQVHTKMNLITLAGISFTAETSYDTLLSEFRDIVTLTASIYPQLIASSENSALYHFDLGVIPALYLVGSRCRNREVRGAAIDLLFSRPYREGIWDSLAVAQISNWLRSLEEAGGSKYIPEERRAFLTSADVDLYHRRAKLYATQRGGPRQEDLVFSETFVQW